MCRLQKCVEVDTDISMSWCTPWRHVVECRYSFINSYPRHYLSVQVHTSAAFSRYQLRRILGVSQGQCARFGEERSYFTSRVWNSLVTVPTEMSRNGDAYGSYTVRCVRGNKATKYSGSRWSQRCSALVSEQRVHWYSGWWVSVQRETWHKHVARGVMKECRVIFCATHCEVSKCLDQLRDR